MSETANIDQVDAEADAEAALSGDSQDDRTTERGKSTIAFPYAPLADAERIAQELQNFGGSATPDGIANAIGQKSRSGAFRQKLSAARLFGLATTRPGEISLTRLGRSILDPEARDAARAEAFLKVPLYSELFNRYKGDLLPPARSLETEIGKMGVSEKQVATARQVFHRSAELAGFFKRGANRLTLPDTTAVVQTGGNGGPGSSGSAGGLPEPVLVMVEALLRDGETWTPEQTKAYMDAARLAWKSFTA